MSCSFQPKIANFQNKNLEFMNQNDLKTFDFFLFKLSLPKFPKNFDFSSTVETKIEDDLSSSSFVVVSLILLEEIHFSLQFLNKSCFLIETLVSSEGLGRSKRFLEKVVGIGCLNLSIWAST